MYFLPQVRTWYVLFTQSTYRVRTSQISMYSVRTDYRKHDKSTYFRIRVRTSVSHTTDDTSTYWYVPSTYFFAYSCTDFSTFLKGTYLVHVEYVLLVPDSIARPPGRPACLLASDSGTKSTYKELIWPEVEQCRW